MRKIAYAHGALVRLPGSFRVCHGLYAAACLPSKTLEDAEGSAGRHSVFGYEKVIDSEPLSRLYILFLVALVGLFGLFFCLFSSSSSFLVYRALLTRTRAFDYGWQESS